MANWQPVQIPTGGGIDTKTDEKRLPLESVADMQNIVFTDAPGWRLRNGYTALETDVIGSSTDQVTSGVALGTRNNELLQFDDKYLNSYSSTLAEWKQVGRVFGALPSYEVLTDLPLNQTEVRTACIDNVRVTAWVSSVDDLVHYEVRDDSTGTVITADTTIASSEVPKVVGTTRCVHLLYYDSAATALKSLTFYAASPESPIATELVTNAHTDAIYDVVNDPVAGDSSFVVYKTTTPTVVAFRLEYTAAANITTTIALAITALTILSINAAISTDDSTTLLTIGAYDGTTLRCGLFDSSLNAVTTIIGRNLASVVNFQAISDSISTLSFFIEVSAGNTYDHTVDYGSGVLSVATLVNGSTYRHSSIASKPFLNNSTAYCFITHDSTLQRTYFLFDAFGNIQGRYLSGIGFGNVSINLPAPYVRNGRFETPLGYRKRLTIDGTAAAANIFSESGAYLVGLDFTRSDRYLNVQIGDTSYIQAGQLLQYDGTSVVEQGFSLFPENVAAADSAGGSLTVTSTYNYRVYYEYTADNGERQRSTAIITTDATTGGNQRITLTIPTLQQSAKASDISIVVYRTIADASVTAGAPFRRITDPNPANDTGSNRYVANDPTANTVTLIDDLSDADLLNRELDYQNTGELDNTPAPSGSVFGYAKQRLWIAGGLDGNTAYFSKLRTPGNGLEFHDGNQIQLPDEGGPITAISELNHFVVFFKRDRIYVISGTGPDNLNNGFFGEPQLVTADVGCNNQSSVVRYDPGVLFKSDKGIYQLSQNQQVIYIGAQAEKFNTLNVTSATVVNDTDEVRFLTATGRCLVYNYFYKRWTTFTNHSGPASILWGQTYAYIRSDTGRVFTEDPNVFTDNGAGYGWLIKTAHFGIAGPVGFQRVHHLHMLGEYYSAHELQVRLNYNTEGFTETATYDPTGTNGVSSYGSGAYGSGAYGGSGSPNYETRFNLPIQKCRTVQFEISCIPTVSGRSCEIDAMSVFAAAKYGNNKMPDGRKFGE